jgi:hypothetical protein
MGRREIHRGFLVERGYLENLGTDGMILKWILKK